jgi:hypothetical protein
VNEKSEAGIKGTWSRHMICSRVFGCSVNSCSSYTTPPTAWPHLCFVILKSVFSRVKARSSKSEQMTSSSSTRTLSLPTYQHQPPIFRIYFRTTIRFATSQQVLYKSFQISRSIILLIFSSEYWFGRRCCHGPARWTTFFVAPQRGIDSNLDFIHYEKIDWQQNSYES